METIKNLWNNNRPLAITILVAIAILLFFFWKNVVAPNNQAESAPQVLTDGTVASGGEPAVTPVQIIRNITNNITNTIAGTNPTTQSTGNPPAVVVPAIPSVVPTIVKPSGTPQVAVARTATVTSWPSQNSTLWGIAQKEYGNGNLWPKIYEANKSKIKDPNLIYAGQVLTIP